MITTDLEWNGDKFKKQVNEATITALTRSINLVDATAKLTTPVDTGNLRSSNEKEVLASELEAIEYNDAEYALFVHNGTSRQASQPWMRNALFNNKDKIKRIFIAEEREAIAN